MLCLQVSICFKSTITKTGGIDCISDFNALKDEALHFSVNRYGEGLLLQEYVKNGTSKIRTSGFMFSCNYL